MDPRFWRELMLRGGMTLVIALIAYLLLDAGPWILGLPAAVAALVFLKWRTRWDDEEEEDEDETAADR